MTIRYIFRWLGGYLFATATVVILTLINGFIPKTTTGWALIFVFGLPIWLLGEWIGSTIISERISKSLDHSEKTVSLARLSYVLLVMLTFLIVGFLIWQHIGTFLNQHFRIL
mgnify:CR=1 FL=1